MEDRITEIEIAIAHQDVEIEKLNDVIREQWREIDRLKAQMLDARSTIDSYEDFIENNGHNIDALRAEKPPHY